MTITSFVVISSKLRTLDSRSTSDFTYSIGQSMEVVACAIKSISIPVVQYNVNSNNNKLRVFYGESFADIELPVGQYDIKTFSDELESRLSTAINGTVQITQDDLTSKLKITSSVPIRFETNPSVSPLAKVIGLPNYIQGSQSLFPETASTSIDVPNLHDLSGINNYYILSRVLSQNYSGLFSNGVQFPMVINVPVDVAYGQIQHYESDDIQLNIKKYSIPQNIQLIDIKIIDIDGNVVDLNGADIEITLKVYSKDDPTSEK